ncbi:MAG: hypothetical protein ABMB14_02465 [Myxococcota bacterium]
MRGPSTGRAGASGVIPGTTDDVVSGASASTSELRSAGSGETGG